MTRPRQVTILLFDGVEVLDFAGPFEVFAVTGEINSTRPFEVATVSERGGLITARNGLRVESHHAIADAPRTDLLVIPGGQGTRALLTHEPVIGYLRKAAPQAEIVLSVCTGALLLGKAGLLDGLHATTHHLALDLLRAAAPRATVRENDRVVDNGQIVTAAGISAGIDASLHCVSRLLGRPVAAKTAAHMECRWREEVFIAERP